MKKLIEETTVEDAKTKEKQLADGPKAAYGYGGKFGVQQDRFALKNISVPYVTS
jgi:cortactin